jgi:hypothetical protein
MRNKPKNLSESCRVSALAREMAALVTKYNAADEEEIAAVQAVDEAIRSEEGREIAYPRKWRAERKKATLEYLIDGAKDRATCLQAHDALGALFQLSIISYEIGRLAGAEEGSAEESSGETATKLMLYSVAEFIRKSFGLAGADLIGCEYYMPNYLDPRREITEAA